MQNIERACFTTLNASINDAFKVSNNPTITGWHAGMSVQEFLDQPSNIYSQPTPAAMEINNVAFHSQYSAAGAPKVLFCRINNYTKIAILGKNPYTDCQLINNAIHFLLTTGLYQRPFEEWDWLLPAAQTWIALRALIQEAFQHCLIVTAPAAGHHGHALAHLYQQNVFSILSKDNDDNKDTAVATQMATLTYQSQLTQTTAAKTCQRQEQQMAQLSAVQDATHATLHQLTNGIARH
jgi:hypothetical protein